MFIVVKFIVIFFFRTAYEPDFIFQLTPFYLLSGLNNLHLLFLSLLVILLESYFHLNSTKKNLTYSFLLTILMLSGCGYAITTKELDVSNILYYIIFICLLLALLIDHKHTLIFEDVGSTVVEKTKTVKKKPAGRPVATSQPPSTPRPSLFGSFASFRKNLRKPTITRRVKEVKDMAVEQPKPVKVLDAQPVTPVVNVGQKPSLYGGFSDEEVTKLWTMLKDIEKRTSRLEHLEGEIDERQNRLLEQKRDLRNQLIASNFKKHGIKDFDEPDNDIIEFLKSTRSSAAVIQRGTFKQINKSFAKLLGYEIGELVNKNMYNFIVPEGFSNIEKYYLHRLRGKAYSSYETIFLTKDNQKISVEIDIKPTILNGEKAEIAIIKKSKDKK